jgi:hypothetical protein
MADTVLPTSFWAMPDNAIPQVDLRFLHSEIAARLRDDFPKADTLQLMSIERIAFLYIYIRSNETLTVPTQVLAWEISAKTNEPFLEYTAEDKAEDEAKIAAKAEDKAKIAGKAAAKVEKAAPKGKALMVPRTVYLPEANKTMGFAHDRAYKETLQLYFQMAETFKKLGGETLDKEKMMDAAMEKVAETINSVIDALAPELAEKLKPAFADAFAGAHW